jgi:4-methylaminobutanoate oxidase (formaldehyde-forming)
MLGETAETKGLFLGCGLNSVGIASGGGAGMNLAHAIVEGHTAYDLSEADAKRFAPIFNDVKHLMARAPEILGTHYEIAYPGRQLKTSRNLYKLPLHEEYINKNAHMGQVFGWERPLYFNKVKEPNLTFGKPDWFNNVGEEVSFAHKAAALFDMSCFGKIDITGPDAEQFLLKACAGYMQRPPGSVVYSAVLNERGTYESDITAQRITRDHYRLFVGTNTIKRDHSWFNAMANGFNVRIEDTTANYGVLSLMGPKAVEVVTKCGASDISNLGYFKTGEFNLAGKSIRAARISYVGELGWEITCKTDDLREIFKSLIDAGALPAGLFAQTSMRIEKSFCALGHELDSDIGPIEVGLDMFTRRTGGFVGYAAMEKKRKEGAENKLISLTLEDETAVPIGGEPIYFDDQIIGQTTSCTFGFRIGKPIALGHLKEKVSDNSNVYVDIARQLYSATVSTGPLFDADGLRMKN